VRKALKALFGYSKLRSQPLFSRLYRISLGGMNFRLSDCSTSGELQAIRYVRDKLTGTGREIVLFDVGANDGEYTLALAEAFQDAACIHAFEPCAGNFRILAAETGSLTRVRCHNFGFSSRRESAPAYYENPVSTIASVYKQRPGHPWQTELTEVVELDTIDAFCAREAIKAIGLLKLDIEGHELAALQGARRMLDAGAIHFIQFEFGARNVDSRTFFRDFYDLLSPGYNLFRILADGQLSIPEYSESYEVFAYPTNYLAERRAESRA
jgi:FkbM family methyltransferase